MKTFIMLLLILTTTSTWASLALGIKKNYTQTIIKNIPSYEVEMKKQVHRQVAVAAKIAHDLHVDPKLVIAVIWTESHFKSEASSKVGAKGLMQIMPKTRKELLTKMPNFNHMVSSHLGSGLTYKELEDIILGTFYLKTLTNKFNGSIELTIIAYNMGPTWVKRRLAASQAVGKKNDYLNKVKGKMVVIASAE